MDPSPTLSTDLVVFPMQPDTTDILSRTIIPTNTSTNEKVQEIWTFLHSIDAMCQADEASITRVMSDEQLNSLLLRDFEKPILWRNFAERGGYERRIISGRDCPTFCSAARNSPAAKLPGYSQPDPLPCPGPCEPGGSAALSTATEGRICREGPPVEGPAGLCRP